MKMPLNVLLLEDCENDAFLEESHLQRGGFDTKVHRVWSEDQMKEALDGGSWDLILSDFSMPNFSGLQGLSILKQSGRDIPFIIVSGTIGEERAVRAIKAGASEFVYKGDLTRLVPVVERELAEARKRQQSQGNSLANMSESNFRALLDNSITGIYIIQDYRFVYVNPTLCTITGYSAEELTSRPLIEFVALEQRAAVEEKLRSRLEGSVKSVRYCLRMVCKNGSTAEVEAHGTSTEYNGKPSIFGILLDISKRKQAEERFSKMFHSSPIGLCLSSARDGFIIEVNPAFLSMTGHSRDSVIGSTLKDLGLELLREANETEDPSAHQRENRLIHLNKKSGEILKVLVSTEHMEIGKEACSISFFTDITEFKNIEEQLLRNQRMEGIGTLAGGIAHDLNNALAPILMSAQLLRMDITEPRFLQILDVLESSAKRGADMVRQVLTFARGIEGKHGILQVKHLVHDISSMTRQTFPKSIEIREKFESDIWPISADATQLHQVLLNLCVNARDAMPAGGMLTVSARNFFLDANASQVHPEAKEGPYVLLSVSDTGSGMPAHVQQKIFEPFFTTKEIGKGTGLGLSTVRSIIKNHNGFLTLESAENKGTEFKVYLPAMPSAETSTADSAQKLPSGNGEWILVVDDEAVIRDIARQMLQTFSYNVLVASHGAEAVAVCAKNIGKIKVMITDLTMPIMDGASAIEAIKSIDDSIKVIVASGSVLEGLARESKSSTICAVLEKPYTPEKLLNTLHRILHEKPGVGKS